MSQYRIGIARFWHESNTFSSALTETDDFANYQGGTLVGEALLQQGGRRDELTGFIEALSDHGGVQIVPLVSTGALPAGLITSSAAQAIEEALSRALDLAGPLDGVCIAPHGAMAAQGINDFDGHLLRIMRDHIGPVAPLVTALDCHAVVTRQMIEASTALVAYRTHPHVDLVETGARAARILLDVLEGKTQPVVRTCRVPLIFPPPDDGTSSGPFKELFDTFIAWDDLEKVIACSLCSSFAWQDVPEQGSCAIAVTDGDAELAQKLANDLAQRTWQLREGFSPAPMISVAEAMQLAAQIDGCPVVITDSADTVGGGAPGDNSVLLEQVLKHRNLIDGLILAHLPDELVVAELAHAQVGDTVSVRVGGKRDTRFCTPLAVTGRLESVTEGPIADDLGAGTTSMIETGPIVCLALDNVRLVLTQRVIFGPQPSLFRRVGIEPFESKVVTLKTGIGFKKTYGPVAKAVFRADCPGAESYELSRYDFRNVSRPIYPLDKNFDWNP